MYRESIRNKFREVGDMAIRAMTDDGYEYYLQGNIMKYLWRYRYKNGVEDLKKAQWYLNELIDELDDDKS